MHAPEREVQRFPQRHVSRPKTRRNALQNLVFLANNAIQYNKQNKLAQKSLKILTNLLEFSPLSFHDGPQMSLNHFRLFFCVWLWVVF